MLESTPPPANFTEEGQAKQRDKPEHCLFSLLRWSGASALSGRGAARPALLKQRPVIRTGLLVFLQLGLNCFFVP